MRRGISRLASLAGIAAILGLVTTTRAALLTFNFAGADAGGSSSFETTSAMDPNLQFVNGFHIDTPYAGQNDSNDGAQIGMSDGGTTGSSRPWSREGIASSWIGLGDS